MTKWITNEQKSKEYRRTRFSNQLSKRNGIITKDEVIPGFIGVMQSRKIRKRKRNVYTSRVTVNPFIINLEV